MTEYLAEIKYILSMNDRLIPCLRVVTPSRCHQVPLSFTNPIFTDQKKISNQLSRF